jgi:hypothetical protein
MSSEKLIPKSKAKSVLMSEEGAQRSLELFPVAAGRYSKGRDNCYAFVADAASFSVQLLRQDSEAYNPARSSPALVRSSQ